MKGAYLPITGFLGSEFTSASGEYVQFIPTAFNSFAVAAVTCSANSGEPADASAIAPGLQNRVALRQTRYSLCVRECATYNWVPTDGELNAETKPANRRLKM